MSQIEQITSILKTQLKMRNITYAQVASTLALSQASVKRIFSKNDFSLDRLEKICQLAGIELSDIFSLLHQHTNNINVLTLDQEKQIVSDEKLLLILICALSHWRLEDITQYYLIEKHECLKHLLTLHQLKVIELTPNNQIKLRISESFDWITNGPIQTFFRTHVQHDYLHSNFTSPEELLICKSGMLTKDANRTIQSKMRQLANQFLSLNQKSRSVPIHEKNGTAVLIAIRPWTPPIFDKFKRPT